MRTIQFCTVCGSEELTRVEGDGFFSPTVCVACGSPDLASRRQQEWFDLADWSGFPEGFSVNPHGWVEDPWGNALFPLQKNDTVASITERLNQGEESL